MAKLSGSIDVPLPPAEAWKHASDLSRFKDWLSIHRVWRSKLPDDLQKGTVIESIVEVKGMLNRIKWTIVHYKPPEAMTLNGDGVGGVKVKLMAKVKPKGDGSVVTFDVHLGGPALFGPIGMIVAATLRRDINESLERFVTVFTAHDTQPDPGRNGHRGAGR
ncbi:type II toxin-antitoxin system Rv0910 family toxin [Mycobacterium sp. Dal123C01]|uniref:type II toxin-antitoxin system Rv0910 family toxin n=1 Tax=Mycobacterium sp. Dal123C01 TaxID=3457577 RepID=UPI00403EA362